MESYFPVCTDNQLSLQHQVALLKYKALVLLLSLVWGRWKSAVLCINFLMLLFSRSLALGVFHKKEAGMEKAV